MKFNSRRAVEPVMTGTYSLPLALFAMAVDAWERFASAFEADTDGDAVGVGWVLTTTVALFGLFLYTLFFPSLGVYTLFKNLPAKVSTVTAKTPHTHATTTETGP